MALGAHGQMDPERDYVVFQALPCKLRLQVIRPVDGVLGLSSLQNHRTGAHRPRKGPSHFDRCTNSASPTRHALERHAKRAERKTVPPYMATAMASY